MSDWRAEGVGEQPDEPEPQPHSLPLGQPQYGPPPQGQTPYSQSGYAHPGYAQPAYGQPTYTQAYGPSAYAAPRETEQLAIVGIILTVVGWLTCLFVPLSVVALVLAAKAKRNIEASGGAKTGDGLVTATRILGWTHIGVFVLLTIFMIVGIALDDSENTGSFSTALAGDWRMK